ncbi:hypothetical protein CDAR_88151 [Caerostris darwini]|uniref:Uncharacterized protein n=1 Tax=Caerostris darwini TaxID=1538125 RepID=A0AAV4QLS2_9ARAC|nr:hypothetical protein CDAR_88151 [Caerostris darwini]
MVWNFGDQGIFGGFAYVSGMKGGALYKLVDICIPPFAPPFQSSSGNLLAREFDERHCEIRSQHYELDGLVKEN